MADLYKGDGSLFEVGSGGISLKDTVGIADAYTVFPLASVADSVSTNSWATIYTVTGLIAGDTIKTRRQYGGQANIIKDSNGNDLTASATWSDNGETPFPGYVYGTLVLDKDYDTLTVYCNLGNESYATVAKRADSEKKRPAFNNEFVPTISDDESTALKTLSSAKIYSLYGKSFEKAKASLNGKTVICMGDSYTHGMKSVYNTLFAKYGATVDNRGIVSSSICGDTTGNKGFQPMWNRTRSVCTEYTDNGTTDNVGAIVFMGGANDGFGIETWIGSGIKDTDTNHIYGAMHSILNDFRIAFPDVPIFVILQPSHFTRSVEDITDDATAQALGFDSLEQLQLMDDYQYSHYSMVLKERAVKEVAEFYGCNIVDCIFDWHSVLSSSDRAKYWQSDKLHLTGAGSQAVADKLEQKMLEVLG